MYHQCGGKTIKRHILAAVVLLFFVWAPHAAAQGVIVPSDEVDEPPEKTFAWLPFGFYSEAWEFALGVGAGSIGYGQPQLGLLGAVVGSTNATYGALGRVTNLQIKPIDRLFMDVTAGYFRYTELQSYVPGNPDFPDERAGSNDSSNENFILTPSPDAFAYIDFNYLLPLGGARDIIINEFVIEDGLLKSGATGGWSWNPAKSGRSYVGLEFFSRARTLEEDIGEQEFNTSGISLTLEHENSDFKLNPSRGSHKVLKFRRDFDWFSSSGDWTTVEFEFAKFIYLGAGKRTKQQVLAFDLWTINTPSWENTTGDNGQPIVEGAPPYYEGARLGGLYRMRGYRHHRFHDKSAIYYSAEYRFIPNRSPLNQLDKFGWFNFNWWQFVAFAEVGRVAPDWSLSELHRDMKWDVGIGLRTLVRRIVLRMDVGFSPEGVTLWLMAGQAF